MRDIFYEIPSSDCAEKGWKKEVRVKDILPTKAEGRKKADEAIAARTFAYYNRNRPLPLF